MRTESGGTLRTRRAIGWACALASVALVAAGLPAHAAPTADVDADPPSIVVTPNTGLADQDLVEVNVADGALGTEPGATAFVMQCAFSTDDFAFSCREDVGTVVDDFSGAFSGAITVRRAFDAGGTRVECNVTAVCVLAVAVISSDLRLIGAAGARLDFAPSPTGRIDLLVDGPPGVRDLPTISLARDGVDVTDTFCRAVEGSDDRPNWVCDPLPQGVYSIGLDDVPAGAESIIRCDSIATPAPNDALPIDDGFNEWGCSAVVSEPGVLVSTDSSDIDIAVVDADGNAVDCVVDGLFDDGRRWCTGLDLGEYTAVAVDVPPGASSSVFCEPFNPPPDLVELSDEIELTAERPIWKCSGGFFFL